jgi:predicted RNA binding protein YcfA (HicA-like mRNA interferase family)
MTKLPVLKAREVIRALEAAGFEIVRIKGSHYRLVHRVDGVRATTIPVHAGRDLPKGTLRDIIDQAGLTVDEFVALL